MFRGVAILCPCLSSALWTQALWVREIDTPESDVVLLGKEVRTSSDHQDWRFTGFHINSSRCERVPGTTLRASAILACGQSIVARALGSTAHAEAGRKGQRDRERRYWLASIFPLLWSLGPQPKG